MSDGTATPAASAAPDAASSAAGPPDKPLLTFRVGVSGHRDLDAAARERVRAAVDQVLALVEAVVADVAANSGAGYDERRTPRLVAVSPLANGADQVFARAALDRRKASWELHVPMPFPRVVYETDFIKEPGEFQPLLERAARTLELDGTRAAEELAYLHAGRTMLHQSDILVAVWDGAPADRIGGTAQIVDEAYSHHIPVVWINPRSAEPTVLLSHPPREGSLEAPEGPEPLELALRLRLNDLLLPPHLLPRPERPRVHQDWMERLQGWISGHSGRLGPETYYQPLRTWVRDPPFFRWFRFLMLWSNPAPTGPNPVLPWRDYHWADERAKHHASSYRSAFTTTYLFGALAVLCALVGYRHTEAVYVELALTVTAIWVVVVFAWRGRWHDLWLDERLLAERFRQLYILQPLGLSAPGSRVARAADELGGEAARPLSDEVWAMWLFRAHARSIPMPEGNLSRSLAAYRVLLLEILESQAAYHEQNAQVMHRLRHRLHVCGLVLFAGTLAICIAHLGLPRKTVEDWKDWLTLLAGALPAFAAALVGIIGHGEFQRLERNSAGTHERLRRLTERLNKLPDTSRAHTYAAIAGDTAQLMLSELLAWHVLISERPLQVGQ